MTTLRSLSRRFRNSLSRLLWRWTKPTRRATGQIAALQTEMVRARKKHLARKHLAEAMKAARLEQMRGFSR